jgi:MFS family permease
MSLYGLIYGLNLFFAFVNGWGNALLFVCASSYVNESANEKNKGLFNAILWIFNTGSFITGNLIAAYVIPCASK